jgi:hypothetical protein
MRRSAPPTLLVVACLAACHNDQGLHGDLTDTPPRDTDVPPPDSDAPEDTDVVAVCDLVAPAAGPVERDTACAQGEVTDPWDVVVEWEYTASGVGQNIAVGHLTDDNLDGVYDGRDVSTLVFVDYRGDVVALRGDDGTVLWDRPGYENDAGVAIADVDVDGVPDVVTIGPSAHNPYTESPVLLDAQGDVTWTSDLDEYSFYSIPTVADLDSDGAVEVILDRAVVEGATGRTRFPIYYLGDVPVFVGDPDRDGQLEVFEGSASWDASGGLHDDADLRADYSVVANVDADPDGEIIVARSLFVGTSADLIVLDTDRTELVDVPIPEVDPSPVTVGDFDGDGAPEIAVQGHDRRNNTLSVYEADGSTLWTVTVPPFASVFGVTGYDFDADGALELVEDLQDGLYVHDGRTGAVLFEYPHDVAGAGFQTPIVADVDGDDSAELLVRTVTGFQVLGQRNSTWHRAGTTWPTYDFTMTNVLEDGSVPAGPGSWDEYDVVRARPSEDVPGYADLVVAVVDTCITTCEAEGTVQLAWQAANRGLQPSASTVVELRDAAGSVLASHVLGPINPGIAAVGGTFEVPVDALAGGYALVVDAGETTRECDEANDRVEAPSPCGP